MNKFKKGDRVRLIDQRAASGAGRRLAQGSHGTVAVDQKGSIVTVSWDDFEDGHSGGRDDGSRSCWHVLEGYLELLPTKPKPRKSKPKALDTKIAKVRAHFLSGRSLTQLEAIGLYGAFRLAARVHELKEQGMKIDTLMKEDPNGNPYAEYKLRSARVR